MIRRFLALLATLRETILGAPVANDLAEGFPAKTPRRQTSAGVQPAVIYKYGRRRKHRVKAVPSERSFHTNGANGGSEEHQPRAGKAAD
jgi:hypothetical protein